MLRVTSADNLLTLTLARPERRNALSLDLLKALRAALDSIGVGRPTPGAILLTGEGDAFCAGLDLEEVVSCGSEFPPHFAALMQASTALQRVGCPVLAAARGACVAGGLELLGACDIAIVSDTFVARAPAARLGLPVVPVATSLPRAIGQRRALWMQLTGATLDAATALDWGLVQRVVPEADFDRAVSDTVTQLLALPPMQVGAMKLLRQGAGANEGSVLDAMRVGWNTGVPAQKMAAVLEERRNADRG